MVRVCLVLAVRTVDAFVCTYVEHVPCVTLRQCCRRCRGAGCGGTYVSPRIRVDVAVTFYGDSEFETVFTSVPGAVERPPIPLMMEKRYTKHHNCVDSSA